jgi:hypothetical protein
MPKEASSSPEKRDTEALLTAIRERIAPAWTGKTATYFTSGPSAEGLISVTPATVSLRKEVIQPQVLLRLPCYDFTPIMNHTLGPLNWDF